MTRWIDADKLRAWLGLKNLVDPSYADPWMRIRVKDVLAKLTELEAQPTSEQHPDEGPVIAKLRALIQAPEFRAVWENAQGGGRDLRMLSADEQLALFDAVVADNMEQQRAERIEALAAVVHQAYLDTCERLGWPVKPENQVPYTDLTEDSKELDRASVRAVLTALDTESAPEAR